MSLNTVATNNGNKRSRLVHRAIDSDELININRRCAEEFVRLAEIDLILARKYYDLFRGIDGTQDYIRYSPVSEKAYQSVFEHDLGQD